MVLCGALSLMCGGSVGPEAALGWFGGAAGSYLAKQVPGLEPCKHAVALDGMAAALGALFPAPVLGVVILLELGIVSRNSRVFVGSFYERFVTASVAAIVAASVYGAICKSKVVPTWRGGIGLYGEFAFVKIPRGGTGPDKFAAEQTYDDAMLGTAAVLGVVSGIVGLLSLIIMSICKKVAGRVKERMLFIGLGSKVTTVLIPLLGGIITGLVSYAQVSTGVGSADVAQLRASVRIVRPIPFSIVHNSSKPSPPCSAMEASR